MNGRILLDTNIVIAVFEQERSVLDRLTLTEQLFVPSIVMGELYYGAFKSTRVESNLSRLSEFERLNAILPCDKSTAQFYGRIKNQLRLKGRPIPENDIWIAAIAVQHDLAIATRDNHFSEVEELLVGIW